MYWRVKKLYGILPVALLLFTACAQLQTATNETPRPNILFLVADDAGWKDFGCYGTSFVSTPNIDNLAATGVKFNNAFLTSSSCSPSRISILSGKYAHTVGAEDMHVPLPDSVKLLPAYLKEHGYYTGNMFKTHYGPAGERQFQWYGRELSEFNEFLDSTKGAPFFMWVGFKDPHRPYDVTEYQRKVDPADVTVPSSLADTPETRQDLANYYSEIMRLDDYIGWMLAELEKRKLRGNTLIVFVSDNGAPFPGAKGTLYDTGIGTPLIINWQGASSSHAYDGLVSSIDLAPTVLDVAGVRQPAGMPGKSLLPVLTDQGEYSRMYAFSERNWHGAEEHIRSVRTLEYKYLTNAFEILPHGSPSDIVESSSWRDVYRLHRDKKASAHQNRLFLYPRAKEELYDIRADPYELNNLAGSPNYTDIKSKLRAALEEWRESSRDVTPADHPKLDKTNRYTGELNVQEE